MEYFSTYYMGKYKLDSTLEKSTVVSDVESFILHDDWNPYDDKYIADIAVAVLTKKIMFDKYISPICIWERSQNYEDLIGEEGIVAGWGLTKSGKQSEYPQFIKVPVVDNSECAESSSVLGHIISDKSFCAGERSGETPCKGL
jgi:hypothetical protein